MSQSIVDPLPTVLPAPDAPAANAVVAAVSSRQSELLAIAARLLKFGTVGGLGFVWDTTTVYALLHVVGFTTAALAAYFVAATMNWMLNRLWTFQGRSGDAGLLRQWLTFLGANAFGFAINRAVVFALVAVSPLCLAYPVLPLAAGSLTGMALNFVLSNRLVFRVRT